MLHINNLLLDLQHVLDLPNDPEDLPTNENEIRHEGDIVSSEQRGNHWL